MSEIIDIRKQQGLSTYVAFIDFSKAYDRINRNLIRSKLERMGVACKFMCALKSLYKDVKCSVKLNGIMSEFFSVNVGLKRGCLIPPQLFNLYISDLIEEIQNRGLGIPTYEDLIST